MDFYIVVIGEYISVSNKAVFTDLGDAMHFAKDHVRKSVSYFQTIIGGEKYTAPTAKELGQKVSADYPYLAVVKQSTATNANRFIINLDTYEVTGLSVSHVTKSGNDIVIEHWVNNTELLETIPVTSSDDIDEGVEE